VVNPFNPNFNIFTEVHGKNLRTLALAFFYSALDAHETGGENKGKIVRAVMEGHEGRAYEWCAGIATLCYIYAARLLEIPNPFAELGRLRWSSSAIYNFAKKKGWIVKKPLNGDLFLVQKIPPTKRVSHKHTAMVARVQSDSLITIEGNFKDKVAMNNRSYSGLTFIRVNKKR